MIVWPREVLTAETYVRLRRRTRDRRRHLVVRVWGMWWSIPDELPIPAAARQMASTAGRPSWEDCTLDVWRAVAKVRKGAA